jgi:hypothetical protein
MPDDNPPFGSFPWMLRAAGLARPALPSRPCVSHTYILDLDTNAQHATCKDCGEKMESPE